MIILLLSYFLIKSSGNKILNMVSYEKNTFCSVVENKCKSALITIMIDFVNISLLEIDNGYEQTSLITIATIENNILPFNETIQRKTTLFPFSGKNTFGKMTRVIRQKIGPIHSDFDEEMNIIKLKICVLFNEQIFSNQSIFEITSANIFYQREHRQMVGEKIKNSIDSHDNFDENNLKYYHTNWKRPVFGTIIHETTILENQTEPRMVFNKYTNNKQQPSFSLILNVYNSEKNIAKNVEKILFLTKKPFELIIILDYCKDESEKNIFEIVRKWIENCNSIHPQQCENYDLVRIVIVVSDSPIYETSANNFGMRISRGKYWILLQDDQKMEIVGWNVLLSLPLQHSNDIFSASGRCAHNMLKPHSNLVGRCFGDVTQSLLLNDTDRCKFYIRGSGNRGPLIFDAQKMMALGFFDEKNFFFGNDL